MIEREAAIGELWSRLAATEGVVRTDRNPTGEPSAEDFPAILLFEWVDKVFKEERRGRTQIPVRYRRLSVGLEFFISGTTESAASNELSLFVNKAKAQLYRDGNSLGGKVVEMTEVGLSSVVRPKMGANAAAIAMELELVYIEDVQKVL